MKKNAMLRAVFAVLVVAPLGAAACFGPTLNGRSDMAPNSITRPAGPYDNTTNSLGGRFVGGGSA